jgi:hypothetical protein
MNDPRRHRQLLIALYLNAGLLAGLLVVLLGRDRSTMLPAAMAQVQQPIAGGGGVFIMPAQIAPNTWGTYMMDIDAQTLMVYQYTPNDNQLRLKASRSFKYDRRLTDFNVGSPTPGEVEELYKRQQQNLRGSTNPAAGVDNK